MAATNFGSVRLAIQIKKLQELGTGHWRQSLTAKLGAAALARVQETFENSADPYGKPWKQLRFRVGQPLLLTGRLRNSINRSKPDSRGFVIAVSNVEYAAVHQFGSKNMKGLRGVLRRAGVRRKGVGRGHGGGIPARPYLPGKTLPASWLKEFEAIANAVIARYLTSAR